MQREKQLLRIAQELLLFICAAKPGDRRLFGNVFFLLACIRLGVFGLLDISCELGDKALNCAFVGIGQLQVCGEKLFTIGAKVVSLRQFGDQIASRMCEHFAGAIAQPGFVYVKLSTHKQDKRIRNSVNAALEFGNRSATDSDSSSKINLIQTKRFAKNLQTVFHEITS